MKKKFLTSPSLKISNQLETVNYQDSQLLVSYLMVLSKTNCYYHKKILSISSETFSLPFKIYFYIEIEKTSYISLFSDVMIFHC